MTQKVALQEMPVGEQGCVIADEMRLMRYA